MGYQLDGGPVILSAFVPSTTLDNLRRDGAAALNLTDEVTVIAGSLTGRRDWPTLATHCVPGWRLSDALAHRELRVIECDGHAKRPWFRLATELEERHRPFRGFNRAQAAVVAARRAMVRSAKGVPLLSPLARFAIQSTRYL
jgi:hypothetical protein